MRLADGVWKLWREGEPFAQRFTGRFSEDGETWETDFDVTYTRVD